MEHPKYFCLSVILIVVTATLLLGSVCPFFEGKIAKNGQHRLDIGFKFKVLRQI